MATACLNDSVHAFERLERDYIAQRFDPPEGEKRPPASLVSERFSQSLQEFFGGRVAEVLNHPRYRLHIIAYRGQGLLSRATPWRTPLGYAGAFLSNAFSRQALGSWLERVVFSTSQGDRLHSLPFGVNDLRSAQAGLTSTNFMDAVRASCSIPFVLDAVHDIAGAPRGAYWADYHMHLDYLASQTGQGVVLYPHFQKAVVPGWLDKNWKRRHQPSAYLDSMIVLAPDPAWVARLPNGKLPDRHDFLSYGRDHGARANAWNASVTASQQLADEFAQWLATADMGRVEPL